MEPEIVQGEEPALVSPRPYHVVLLCGLLTSALALAGVYWLNKNADDFHIMGWYANYVIPAGALIVGLIAGSGYGIASWGTGVRIGRGLMWTVVLLQLAAYFGAEYVEYRDVMKELKRHGAFVGNGGKVPSFLEYYDFKARSFAWKPKHGNGVGDPLGGWGYVFMLLGAAGFVGGGLIAPAILFSVPYCDGCQRYMKTKVLGVLPASVPVRKIKKKDHEAQEAYAREQEEAANRGNEAVARLGEAIAAGNADAARQQLSAAGSVKENGKLPQRMDVSLVWCKSCEGGRVLVTMISGFAEQTAKHMLVEATVTPEFVRAILEE